MANQQTGWSASFDKQLANQDDAADHRQESSFTNSFDKNIRGEADTDDPKD